MFLLGRIIILISNLYHQQLSSKQQLHFNKKHSHKQDFRLVIRTPKL